MTPQTYVFETARENAIAGATGSGGIREQRGPQLLIILVSGMLSDSGTSSAEPARLWEAPYVHESEGTASGLDWEHVEMPDDLETTRQAISELRRISGLTWEQLGELFDVSRRSVHFWASGKPLNVANEQRLMQVLDVVRAAKLGDARSTRAALFAVKGRTTAFALLKEERFEAARAILGVGAARPRPPLLELSAAAKAAREPLPPEDLVDAQHDRVHRDHGRARSARTSRNKRRETP